MSYQSKVYKDQGGDRQVIDNGGVVDIKTGGMFTVNGSQPAALTAQLTTITPADAEGTPDYAIAGLTNSSPYGFASLQEAVTILYVIRNLQVRLAEVEARLEALGAVAAN